MTAIIAIASPAGNPVAAIVDRHARAGFSGAVVVDVRGRVGLARGIGLATGNAERGTRPRPSSTSARSRRTTPPRP